jgi:hypothetical protein
MSNRKVKSAYLQTSSTNVVFGAETTLNSTKQPSMRMETDGTFLICSNHVASIWVPLANVKSMEMLNEKSSEANDTDAINPEG